MVIHFGLPEDLVSIILMQTIHSLLALLPFLGIGAIDLNFIVIQILQILSVVELHESSRVIRLILGSH